MLWVYLLLIRLYNSSIGVDWVREIYLDNSATTKVCSDAVEKIVKVLAETYGNPSSLHEKGFAAEQEVELARKIIADSLGAVSSEICFTSGGTESNNLAIFGAVEAHQRRGNKIITTSIEHSSVYNVAKELEKCGFEVVYIKPNQAGQIEFSQIEEALDEHTILVNMMLVNNETGSILPVESLKNIIKKKNLSTLLHVDAVQAFGKIPVNVNKLGADLLSLSAHKVHGPKGVGALYIRKGVRILPRTFGGEQQKKLRPGTEPVPLIVGFGAAVRQFSISENFVEIQRLNELCRDELAKMAGFTINSPESAVPHILNFSTNAVKSETMLHFLSSKGIFVSSGSACAKGKKSRVLTEMGLSQKQVDTALRVSFSRYNTKDDVEKFVQQVRWGLETLAHL